jgi:hypothetical protein
MDFISIVRNALNVDRSRRPRSEADAHDLIPTYHRASNFHIDPNPHDWQPSQPYVLAEQHDHETRLVVAFRPRDCAWGIADPVAFGVYLSLLG